MEFSFEKDPADRTICSIDYLTSVNQGDGQNLIRQLIDRIGTNHLVICDILEEETRKTLSDKGFFSAMEQQDSGTTINIDRFLWGQLKLLRVLQGGGISIQEVVITRLTEDWRDRMVDGWPIGVQAKGST